MLEDRYSDFSKEYAPYVWRLADKGVASELSCFRSDAVFDSGPSIDTVDHGFLISAGVDVEKESGGRVDVIGGAFDVEIVFFEFINNFACLFTDPANNFHY